VTLPKRPARSPNILSPLLSPTSRKQTSGGGLDLQLGNPAGRQEPTRSDESTLYNKNKFQELMQNVQRHLCTAEDEEQELVQSIAALEKDHDED